MREIKMIMKLDNRTYGVGMIIKKDAKLEEYEVALNAINRAMLRVIKEKYFNFSKKELVGDCLRREP